MQTTRPSCTLWLGLVGAGPQYFLGPLLLLYLQRLLSVVPKSSLDLPDPATPGNPVVLVRVQPGWAEQWTMGPERYPYDVTTWNSFFLSSFPVYLAQLSHQIRMQLVLMLEKFLG